MVNVMLRKRRLDRRISSRIRRSGCCTSSTHPRGVESVAQSACACPSRVVELQASVRCALAFLIVAGRRCSGGTGVTGKGSPVEDLVGAGAYARVSSSASTRRGHQGSRASGARPGGWVEEEGGVGTGAFAVSAEGGAGWAGLTYVVGKIEGKGEGAGAAVGCLG